MSLFGSLTTAISGLTAQSRSLGHISDNVANSQTVGFKRIDTNFVSYLTQSSASVHFPGTVLARPDYTNTIQGTIEQADEPLALAIGGQGFFSVAQSDGTVDGLPTFDDRQFYTRAGDFRSDRDGYIRNGSGFYLQGWPVNAVTNEPDRTIIEPIRIDQQAFNPVATSDIEFKANLPADATLGPPLSVHSTQAQIYDALGRRQTLTFTYTYTGPNAWSLDIAAPGSGAPAFATTALAFGDGTDSDSNGAVEPAGNLKSIGGVGGAGTPAVVSFDVDYGLGVQTVALNYGQFENASLLTQFAPTGQTSDLEIRNQSQNGIPPGAYSGVTLEDNGDVFVNYDNGQSRIVARIPLVAFNDPDKLQRLDGQAYLRTLDSGEARVTDASSNGVGKLVTGSIERSNVDIANEFTKLIVAQRAYTANTRIVTTADELLQETINLKR